jgi:putative hydrolase of HD superfamily
MFIESYMKYSHLKNVYRTGWLRYLPKEQVESVADHSWGVAMLAFVLAKEFKPNLDSDKLIKLAVFHELGEAHAGDKTIYDGVTKEEKTAQERKGVLNIIAGLKARAEILDAWEEVEELKSPEAEFVKDVDRLEMCVQALAYEQEHGKKLQEFYDYARERIKDSLVLGLLDEVETQRPKTK